jgi:hypothetical protein
MYYGKVGRKGECSLIFGLLVVGAVSVTQQGGTRFSEIPDIVFFAEQFAQLYEVGTFGRGAVAVSVCYTVAYAGYFNLSFCICGKAHKQDGKREYGTFFHFWLCICCRIQK